MSNIYLLSYSEIYTYFHTYNIAIDIAMLLLLLFLYRVQSHWRTTHLKKWEFLNLLSLTITNLHPLQKSEIC